jgi:hypothetical protein
MVRQLTAEVVPRPSDNGDDGWTKDSMAELEKDVGLALVEQAMSSASAPNSSRPPRSVEAPRDEDQSQNRSETTGSRPEEPRDASRLGTPTQGLEEREQRETQAVAEPLGSDVQEEEPVGEAVEMQQEELAG